MTPEQQKQFIKMNKETLKEIFNSKIALLMRMILESPTEMRDKYIDATNILRDWLRELEIVDVKEIPKDNFI